MAKFVRKIEDFVCESCGTAVTGSGYTNHCPKCLRSKHVDVNPGDRAALCGGVMEPVGIEKKRDYQVIVHRCVKCGHLRRNKASPADDFAAILAVARKTAAFRP